MSEVLAPIITAGVKQSLGFLQKKTEETFKYDFFGLILKLVVFYFVALFIAKYYEAVKLGSGFVQFIASIFGYQLPTAFPESLSKFFDTGYSGIKYWDAVKGVSIIIVLFEAKQYYETNSGKVSPATISIFGLIIGFLALITIPELSQRIKELQMLMKTVKK